MTGTNPPARIPQDGTPPDPLAAQQQQEQLEEQAARQSQMQMPAAPQAQGCGGEGPTNPMDPGNKYDWDSFSTTPRL